MVGSRSGAAMIVVAAVVGSACSPDAAREAAGPEPVAEVAEVSAPAPGTARIELVDGRVHLWSNGAPLLDVVQELAAQADFEVLVGDVEPRELTLQIEDASLGAALGEVLAGIPYSTDYETDPAGGAPSLSLLAVGEPVSVAAPPPPAPEPEARVAAEPEEPAPEAEARDEIQRIRERIAAMTPEERQALQEEQQAWSEEMEPEFLEQLEDWDPDERLDAVMGLPLEGEGGLGDERVARMASILEEDPDRGVRIAAADRLSEVEHPTALKALVGALSDPDPQMVLAALTALEDIDDPSVIPDIEPLRQDPDPEIAEAAQNAIDWLEIQ